MTSKPPVSSAVLAADVAEDPGAPDVAVDTGVDDILADILDVDLLLAMCEPVTPSAALRDAVLRVATGPWYEGFIATTSRLLDLSLDAGRALLVTIDDATRWIMGPGDGIELFHIEPGPALEGAITGFVRLGPGAAFPHHRHVGDEDVLVLAGSFSHTIGGQPVEVRVGEVVQMAADSAHTLTAGPEGCLYLSVTREGMAFDGEEPIGPDDPRA